MENLAYDFVTVENLLNGDDSNFEDSDDEAEEVFTHMEFHEPYELNETNDPYEPSDLNEPNHPNDDPVAQQEDEVAPPVAQQEDEGAPPVNDVAPEPEEVNARVLAAELTWKKKSDFKRNKPQNSTNEFLDVPFLEPIQYFERYFNEDFYELTATFTNQYYLQTTGKIMSPPATSSDIKAFFSFNGLMGVFKYPRIHLFWNQLYGMQEIMATMTKNRFFQLRNNLHVVDNLAVSQDVKSSNKLWKVQPVIDTVRNQGMKIERTKGNYSLDEQMIPFSGKCIVKQYVRNKPRPVGLKNFVITDSDGLMFDFIIYQGEKLIYLTGILDWDPCSDLEAERNNT